MKNLLSLLVVAGLVSCNSGTKTEVKVEGKQYDWDTSYPAKDSVNSVPVTSKIDIESFGEIKLGMSPADIRRILGAPNTESLAIEWGADGLMHEDWTWKSKGLVLNMSSDKANHDSSLSVFSITASSPCTFITKAGMGIGSSYEEVLEAYKKDIDPEATDKTQITVGSVYGGIIFSFRNNKAEKISLGAAAE